MRREFAARYGDLEQWHWWFRGRRRILEDVLRRTMQGRSPLRIASLGCGPAGGLGWLGGIAASGGRIVGLDLDAAHAHGAGTAIDYVVGQVEAAPLASGAFDLVLALDVLEHLDDDRAGLAEAARLVRPGGLVAVTVPAWPSLWGRQDEVSHHRRRYTRASLQALFRRAGLPAATIAYFNALLFLPIAAIRWGRRALGRAEDSGSDFDDSRPGVANELLARLFAAERHLIGRVPLPAGVSLLALATRPIGVTAPR